MTKLNAGMRAPKKVRRPRFAAGCPEPELPELCGEMDGYAGGGDVSESGSSVADPQGWEDDWEDTFEELNDWELVDGTSTFSCKDLRGVEKKTLEKALTAENLAEEEAQLQWWVKTSGLQTVDKWVQNYAKHPGGWAALISIHGVQEVSSRLRSKVETFAMYAALFLSGSVSVFMSPPGTVKLAEDGHVHADGDAVMRFFVFTLLTFGVAAHFLCILIAMSFVNALNEAARDSDVFRMFARGKGYNATVRCETAFNLGALLNFTAMATLACEYIGWPFVFILAISVGAVLHFHLETGRLLYRNVSIMGYWRKDFGGNPDEDDPFDLQVPMRLFAYKNNMAKAMQQQLRRQNRGRRPRDVSMVEGKDRE